MNKNNSIYLSIIIVFTIVCYSGSLYNDFTNWDDPSLVLENKTIRNLDPAMLKSVFEKPTGYDYLPLKEISYAIDYRIWGKNPFGYHLMNVLLYIILLSVVYYFTIRLTANSNIAFLGVFLFALHPAHIEPVCWISGRKDLLSGIFIFTSLLLFLKSFTEGKSGKFLRFYALSLTVALCALISKPVSVLIPFYLIFLVAFFIPDSPQKKKQYMAIIPFFALSFITAIATVVIGVGKGTVKTWNIGKSADAVLNFPLLLIWYLKKLFLPFNLSPLYDEHNSADENIAVKVFLFIIFAFVMFLIIRRGEKFLKFFSLWFAVSILPVSGVIPISLSKADRYLFLPSFITVCFVKFISDYSGMSGLKTRFTAKSRFAGTVIFLISLLFFVNSLMQSAVWKNSFTLWEYAVSRYPGVSAIRNNLGNAYYEDGKTLKAKLEYLKALSIDDKNWKAHTNLGNIFKDEGNISAALREYEKALEINSEDAVLLRIFIGEDDRAASGPLYEAIVLKARETGMAGATVLRGPLGFGRSSRLHTAKILRLSQDLPVVIEMVDTGPKIEGFIDEVLDMTKSCLITTEKVRVVRYGNGDDA